MSEIRVSIADYAVARGSTQLVTLGLGSCVAIALYAPAQRVGGLAHIMLPHAALSQHAASPGKFASTAVPHMVAQLAALGVTYGLEARLVGGASMFEQLLPEGAMPLGARNLSAARAALLQAGIPVVGEDTGGGHGRNVYFDVFNGTLIVRSFAKADVSL